MRKVRINVSDIGSICGYLERFENSCYKSTLDKYRSKYVIGHKHPPDLGSVLANKVSKLNTKISNTPITTLEDFTIDDEITVDNIVYEKIKESEPKIKKEIKSVISTIKEIQETADSDVFDNTIKRASNMIRGSLHEDNAMTLYTNQIKKRVFEQVHDTLDFDTYTITGICDGLIPDDRIVEIKNRNNGRFHYGPWPNEKCQCQMYMFMFDLDICDFVEHYNGIIATTTLYRDNAFIDTVIIPKLNKFVEELFV